MSPSARTKDPQVRGLRARLRPRCERRGVAVVEFAVIAPLLFLLLLGIIEFGRLLMVQQLLTNASREGARRAVLEQSTSAEVTTLVESYLANGSISGASATVTPSDLTTLGFGDPVAVSVNISYDKVSWLPAPWFLAGKTLAAKCVMNTERPE